MGRHELSMPAHNFAVVIDEQNCVVEGLAASTIADLVAADGTDDVGLLGSFANSRGVVAGNQKGVLLVLDHELAPARDRLEASPVRISGNQSLGENDKLRAVGGSLVNGSAHPLQGRLFFDEYGNDLSCCDFDLIKHDPVFLFDFYRNIAGITLKSCSSTAPVAVRTFAAR